MNQIKKLTSLIVFLSILLVSNYLTFTIVINFITSWPESLPRQILIAATASVCLTLNLIVSAGLIYAMVRGGDSDDESY